MRKISLTLIVLSLCVSAGCETAEQKAATAAKEQRAAEEQEAAIALEKAANACAELGQTTVGFSGPSHRMQILKSYGWTPLQAQKMEKLAGMRHEVGEMLWGDKYCGEPTFKRIMAKTCECLAEALVVIGSCEANYFAVLDESVGSVQTAATLKVAECTP